MKGDGAERAALDSAMPVLSAEAARGVARLRELGVGFVSEVQNLELLARTRCFTLWVSTRLSALFKRGSGTIS